VTLLIQTFSPCSCYKEEPGTDLEFEVRSPLNLDGRQLEGLTE